MTPFNPKKYYTRFLEGHKGKLHFASHSHHFWPDVTRDAQVEYWDDCAKFSDDKWDKIFGDIIPKAQKHAADLLHLSTPEQIVFAPNTHELTSRLLSVFLGKTNLTILTTSSEFHSWRRQLLRLKELPQVSVETISTENFLTDRRELIDGLIQGLIKKPDLCYVSHVFYDSGLALTLEEIKELSDNCPKETIMVIDGYHAFSALPVDLSQLEGRIFYLGGGYKYAQAGEGVGIMVVPKGDWRPAYTGWFAEFGELSKPSGAEVGYRKDAFSFIGATQDPSGLYRFNAVWDLFKEENVSLELIHQYVLSNQKLFISHLSKDFLNKFSLTPLFPENLLSHGHFLTLVGEDEQKASLLQQLLRDEQILIDRRGKHLRFGFGLYQNKEDVENLIRSLEKLAAR